MKRFLLMVAVVGTVMSVCGADITVRGEGASKDAVSLAGLAATGETGSLFVQTLQGDLERSGWFKIDPAGQIRVSGAASARADGLTVSSLVSWPGKRMEWNRSSAAGATEVRRLAHQLANDMVKHIKGERGIAGTRIVLVSRRGPNNADLFMCDADGRGLAQITQDNVAVVGPKWDRDGQNILYTSYLHKSPTVYRFPATGGRRVPLAKFNGLNTGAEISPDGRTAVLILALSGNPEVYTLDLASGAVTRLTQTPHAVEASPAWSPDGAKVVYVGDASGAPQLYSVDVATRRSRRLTYKGSDNVNPDWAANGKIVYATRRSGGYQIAVLDPAAGGESDTPLTSGPDHEDPSWAPDSRHIVCSRAEGSGRSSLWILDTQGDSPVRLFPNAGNWMSPDWSDK
jgi:TolB protein